MPFQSRMNSMNHLAREDSLKRGRAFSLTELLVVVLILGALAAIAAPRISSSAHNAKVSTCSANARIINNQIELFHHHTEKYPLLYVFFKQNKDYFPGGPPVCPFGDTYFMDPKLKRIIQHTH